LNIINQGQQSRLQSTHSSPAQSQISATRGFSPLKSYGA